jgi:hypothetical protein
MLALDFDISQSLSDFAGPLVGGTPVIWKNPSKPLYAVWDHPQSAREDFGQGMAGFVGNIKDGETLAIFVTPQLTWKLASQGTGAPSSLGPLAPNYLSGQVTAKCQAGVCPFSFTGTLRLSLSVEDGVVHATSTMSEINVDPASVACLIVFPDPLASAVRCAAPLVTQKNALGGVLDLLPKKFKVGEDEIKIRYVRVSSETNRSVTFGAVIAP